MSYILCIETATTNCSVSLGFQDKLLEVKELNSKSYSHAEQLHPFIHSLIAKHNITISNLSAVAVSEGPGSYTGLRIGVSAAKGIAYAAEIPLIATSTLQSLALQVKPSSDSDLIIPMLDARRMEVYTQSFTSTYKAITSVEAKILDPSSFLNEANKHHIHFIGDGVEKFIKMSALDNKVTFLTQKLPSAREQFLLARQKFLAKKFEDTAYFEPYYLKDFIPG
ncbi:tRNA (adenosine(37)-N6)-threonylcarbamoyltransferase complex dimerization subunit type 1 TsaB [Psychroflexus sp. ALD_RP9]|uniref:tRNA (adenosine(37)-N6)-threonylcarbamoyltransferase complex dimerization subunit type 1 TsaB n=1 Tax=Psychroflexus sp. ALD_RP9 TaxID=2777186 RepID=UPI001A8CE842|nr:tRNA (adenosine(37)-N6)-threonylcarbamoyltransferase complex dimerization subunit type 1 TsaB [Psychroflexus sp. ALD_RP9]QSS98073.1 tRNA (adenosine(37)-N6)-threonylcarbamoyltransferase complex dimerization subunit type 1 TsaB [Psychroflexus sp. ALD_RP9]